MLERAASTCALVVEDDPNIVDLIRSNLAVRGFDTVVSADGVRALQLLDTEAPDIVLLDLMLPEVDGFELCRQIRERSSVAIIVVSARGGERDKVTALNMGADDYMTKPFSIEELLARIGATLRRTRPAAPADTLPAQLIVIGELQIDLAGQQVLRRGEAVHLTPTEFALLRGGQHAGLLAAVELLTSEVLVRRAGAVSRRTCPAPPEFPRALRTPGRRGGPGGGMTGYGILVAAATRAPGSV
ncbi:MAG TPA: response regulator transcription factor [Streptosporangiaceae bacterium]|nr:response regulator transcription factor [Streptosporangiaceae bacterium]